MRSRFVFVTGTDTGVGKTIFTAALTRHVVGRGIKAVALKPLCSGGRQDAFDLWKAAGGVLSLDDVNPYYFKPAVAPLLAARRRGKRLFLKDVVRHVRAVSSGFEMILVEGAGGLLSPMGEDFDSRRLAEALGADMIVVCPDTLGAVGRVRLVLHGLPRGSLRSAQVVLVEPEAEQDKVRTNKRLLGEYFPSERIHILPWIDRRGREKGVARSLSELWQSLNL